MMLELGDADGLVAGVRQDYPATIRPALQIIGTREGVRRAVPEEDSDTPDEEAAPAPQTQKEPGLGPRPLSPEDPIFHRALDLLKAAVKKAA